ncbi:3-methyl-2-oxobutanoate dehydrogenase subunit alpha [Arthrobacter sp. Hiyo4]|nr:3-methyl-2-oxobutanoate dehydrogenase subunit alpha [Arthrobacter sp. Hiyo4]
MTIFRGDWHSGYDPARHKVGIQCTPLTTQLLHGVGVAHAAKLRGEDTVVLAMCGDGATSEGDFHEALNFAAVFHLPVVFFVQNNKYAISVPLAHQSVAPSLAHKAVGYGMAGERVDGNDVVALLAVLDRAVKLAREGSGRSSWRHTPTGCRHTPTPTMPPATGRTARWSSGWPRIPSAG